MHCAYGATDGNDLAAQRLYVQRFRNHGIPDPRLFTAVRRFLRQAGSLEGRTIYSSRYECDEFVCYSKLHKVFICRIERKVNNPTEPKQHLTFLFSANYPTMFNHSYEKRLYWVPDNSSSLSPLKSSNVINDCSKSDVTNPTEHEWQRFRRVRDVVEVSCGPDRFIPRRTRSSWYTKFPMISNDERAGPSTRRRRTREAGESARDVATYTSLLKNELLGCNIERIENNLEESENLLPLDGRNLFQYSSPRKERFPMCDASPVSSYSLSPVSAKSEKLLKSPCKVTRKVPKIPFKILDAPELQDDFYLNLVDWSSQNVLGVGLGSCVYLWSAGTGQVTRLCDLSAERDTVTSVAWNDKGNFVAVGTHLGYTQVWDVTVNKHIYKTQWHSARVGALAWNGDSLTSGSRDRLILQRDIRAAGSVPQRSLVAHRQEVCGLKWSPDNQHLASGGNDNRLHVWSVHSLLPVQTYAEHKAAVKAIAWSPHHHGLLASGGGTADRCIRFWNTLTGQPMQSIDTSSQVCNLAWSKHSSELVSTHGYSQNQILVWKYPSLTQVAKLTGHSYRVLYLAVSPDGESIVTGAGDETLRFWNVFSKTRSQKENKSVLNLYASIR